MCEELDLPLHCHSGPGAHEEYGEVPGWMSVYGFETIWFTSRPVWFMLLTGVFERFPRLRMAVTEAGSFWAADMLWRLDMMATRDHGAQDGRHAGPTPRCCRASTSTVTADRVVEHSPARDRRYEIGVGNIMWGNDFPHPEGTWPYTRSSSRTASGTCRSTRPSACSASAWRSSTASTSPSCSRSPAASAPPDDLGQTDPSVFAKWDDLKAAGRSWLTGVEALPVAG